jgi:hypothetical protein
MVVENKKYSESLRRGRVWLGKRKDSGFWYLKYNLPSNGKPRERSAGTALKKDALREAEIINSQLLNQKYKIADDSIQIDVLFEKFIIAKSDRVKEKTLSRLKTTISSFKGWLLQHHPDCHVVRYLSSDIVRQFQLDRKNKGLSLRSVNNDIMNLHTVFRWAMRECLLVNSPADYSKRGTIDRLKFPRPIHAVYSQGEVEALITLAEKEGDLLTRDLIVLFAGTGMRFEELAHLKPTSIIWTSSPPEIEVRAQKDWTPKDPYEVKRIPMLPSVEEV